MSQYVNPNHPAGVLYPQQSIAGGLGRSRTRTEKSRDACAMLPAEQRDPVFDAVWRGERDALQASVALRRVRRYPVRALFPPETA